MYKIIGLRRDKGFAGLHMITPPETAGERSKLYSIVKGADGKSNPHGNDFSAVENGQP